MGLAAPLAPPAPRARLRGFAWVDDLAGLDARAAAWRSLEARADDSRSGFESFDWVRGWAARWADPGELRILCAESGDGLALAWPLIVRRRLGATVLENLGEPMCQYHGALIDPAFEPQALLADALGQIAASGADLLRLRRVRGDGALSAALIGAGAGIVRRSTAPFVDLARGPLAHSERGGKSAATRRRRLRQLETQGPVAFGLAVGQTQARAWIASAMRFKRAWALAAGRIARAPFDARFEASFVDALAPESGATPRVFGMLIGDRLVGVEISLSYRGRLFGHVLAHDPEMKAFGIGAILADASIARARLEGFQTFDMLAPADPYKLAFADGDVEVLDLALPLTGRGALAAPLGEALDRGLRLAAHRAPGVIARAWMRRAGRRLGAAADPG